jgi:hypothetical protein
LEEATVEQRSTFDRRATVEDQRGRNDIMNERHGAVSLAVSLAAVLCACAPADGDGIDDDLEFRSDGDGGVPAPSDRPSGGAWLVNGLQSPSASGIDPAYGLDTPQGMSEALGVLADPAQRGTAEYLVECALPPGEVVTKTVGGELVQLEGLLGLAPEWADGPCDEDCQQWVSACLLARTNVSGQAVTIWIQSDHPAVGYGVPEGLVHEASWYGNLFAGPEEQYLCRGAPGGPAAALRDGRTCSLGQGCGFTKYPHCDKGRCTMAGDEGEVPIECTADGAATYRTISTFVEG